MRRSAHGIGIAFAAIVGIAAPAHAQVNEASLRVIRETARELCLRPSQAGTERQITAEAKASLSISKLLRNLLGIGVEAGLKASRSDFNNVLRADLQKENSDYRRCAQLVFVTMYNNVRLTPEVRPVARPLPSPPASSASAVRPQLSRGSPPPPAVSAAARPVTFCEAASRLGQQRWREAYLRPVEIYTWHVFVQSLGPGSTEEQAVRRAAYFQAHYPSYDFNVMSTVAPDQVSNLRFAIVIAQGLQDQATAQKITRIARTCGIAADAYPFRQGWPS